MDMMTKKTLFAICFVFIFFVEELHSQVLTVDNGVSLSWSNNSTRPDIDYTGAIGLDYFEKEHFMFSSRLGYIRKGENVRMLIPIENKLKVKLDYLNFSTAARFKQTVFNGNFFIGIGPYFDFKLNSEYEIVGIVSENEERKGDYISEKIIVGYLVETGYFYDIADWRFGLNVRYGNNITKILPESREGLISHSLSLLLNIGYIF
jgi:hypothetical protein